jgi:hypothetical protein|tara:strand:- start:475 stop:798 length:324 start_codon:yes stop_codon:yes gene_type:complete
VVERVKELEKSWFSLVLKVYEDSLLKFRSNVVGSVLLIFEDKKFTLLIKFVLIVRFVLVLVLGSKVLSAKLILLSEDRVFCRKNKFSLTLVLLEDSVFTGKFLVDFS